MSHQQIMRNRGYGGNIPDGNSHGGSSKHSDSMSDEVPPPHRLNKNGRVLDDSDMDGHIPYEVLMNDLTQAKRQLVDLQNLVSVFCYFQNFPRMRMKLVYRIC